MGEIWRGHDNWINAYDYIKNQLFKYDYNNSEHLHILKMKYWVLDGDLTEEEKNAGLTDFDVDHPKNHNAVLQNELIFLDKYIRTKDKKLNKYEENFSNFVRNRKTQLRNFLKQKDPETNKRYEAWQQDYLVRPTSLNITHFDSLYSLYKVKERAGELSEASEIVSKLSDSYIDFKVGIQEIAINNSKSPIEMDEDIRESAKIEKQKEDVHFVKEMKRAHEEIIELVKSVRPKVEDLGLSSGEDESVEIQGDIVICNFPTIRVDVSEVKNDKSHKGTIIEELGEGGYRFNTKYGNDLITDFKLPPPDLHLYVNQVSPFLDGEVEWNFNDWLYAIYYAETTSTSGGSGNSGGSEETTYYLKPLGVNKNSFNSEQRARFEELNSRWVNFNELRERQMANSGTRVQLESMFDAESIDVRPDLKKTLEERKKEKKNVTNILKEICLYNEFI